jgi:hypothetical protein
MKYLNPKHISEHFKINSTKLNLIFNEFGWIEKAVTRGWVITEDGKAIGGKQSEFNGTQFIKWPEDILKNKILNALINHNDNNDDENNKDIKEKFPCNIKTVDGHMVRSRAEQIIDEWLYANGIVHAYEKRLPIEENMYCDFYIPEKKIYIEFWGLDDEKYEKRKEIKKSIYAKNNINLIELGNSEIERLDDKFPILLLKFGVSIN